uniref:Large ribosomal subunit protein bL35m n=1 Tax=Podarcis muralis TaxID=64176 RepID=A0A670J8N2_PODMU
QYCGVIIQTYFGGERVLHPLHPQCTSLNSYITEVILRRHLNIFVTSAIHGAFVTPLLPSILHQQVRTLIKFGVRKGKRKTVKPVIHRFLRLHCGLWLRRRAGYKKRLWKKNYRRRRRLRQHVFCNKTQSKLLDKMTSSFWKRRNWYIDDPYQKYHDRTNLKL